MKESEKLTIKQWRLLLGINQEQLAEKVGISVKSVQNYESGGLDVAKYSTALKIFEALGIQPSDVKMKEGQ